MSLQFVFGPSGGGKSYYLYEKIIEEAKKDRTKDFLLIVPEQFTMQTQKELVVAGQGAHHTDLDGVTGSSGCGSGRSGSAGGGAAAGGQDTGSSHDTGSGQKVAARDHLFHNTISSCWKFFV